MPETREDAWERERLLESLEAYRRGLSDAPLLRKWSGGSGRRGGPAVSVRWERWPLFLPELQ